MLGSGIFTYLFGIARTYNIHNIWYFIFMQVCIITENSSNLKIKLLLIVLLLFDPGYEWSLPNVWLARRCNCCRQLVWQGQARPDFWYLEFAHLLGQHTGCFDCRRVCGKRLGSQFYGARRRNGNIGIYHIPIPGAESC